MDDLREAHRSFERDARLRQRLAAVWLIDGKGGAVGAGDSEKLCDDVLDACGQSNTVALTRVRLSREQFVVILCVHDAGYAHHAIASVQNREAVMIRQSEWSKAARTTVSERIKAADDDAIESYSESVTHTGDLRVDVTLARDADPESMRALQSIREPLFSLH